MNPFMLIALGGRQPITQTFTTNESWTAPDGVTAVSITGKGSDGTAATTAPANAAVIDIVYRTDTSTGSGYATWVNFQGYVAPVVTDINADGSASWNQSIVQVWPDGTNELAQYPVSISDAVPGSAYADTDAGWQTSGSITASGSNFVRYTANIPAAAGTQASGFGKVFPGGAPGAAAIPANYPNTPVTPHQNYPYVVPAGGYITITY